MRILFPLRRQFPSNPGGGRPEERFESEAEDGPWARCLVALFGDQPALPESQFEDRPAPAALSVRPLRLSESLRRAFPRSHLLRELVYEAMTFVQPGVKIAGNTGRAEEQHLRFVEMARTGTCLEAICRLKADDEEQRMAFSALLLAGAKLVERIGGKRRRGAGECQLDVIVNGKPLKRESVLDWIAATTPTAPIKSTPATKFAVPQRSSGDWVKIPLRLTCITPVAIYARTVGNVVESLDFIPGTYLLPHVTQAFRNLKVDVRPAIAAGDLRVLPATIEIDGVAGRAMPLACHQPKEKEGGAEDDSGDRKTRTYNRLVKKRQDGEPQEKPCRKGYVGDLVNVGVLYSVPALAVRTHNTVQDEKQRPTSDVGGVYSYEAIRAGTILRTEIRVRRGLFELLVGKAWQEKLDGEIRLGRSSKDDYGLVDVRCEDEVDLPTVWQAQGPQMVPGLVVWLQSDLLLRGPALNLDPSLGALQKLLETALKVTFEPIDKPSTDPNALPTAFARVRRIESWQVRWGLPRPTLVGLQAGTCVNFKVESGQLDPKLMADIEARGIGERTVEGYGQIRFNDELLSTDEFVAIERKKKNGVEPIAVASTDPSRDMARAIETAAWREMICRTALGFGGDPKREAEHLKWSKGKPSMSQLGSLRDAIQQVVRPKDVEVLRTWIKAVRGNRKRRQHWARALDVLQDLVDNKTLVWKLLREVEGDWPTLTDNAAATLEDELWSLALRTLIDEAIRAHKRRHDLSAAGKED